MTHKVGTKGQVVIPKELRAERGLEAGTAVEFEVREDGVLVRPAAAPRPLKGRFLGSRMAEELLKDRAAEPR
ncbi:MAG: AbrB/MazE/SpoVT family DNA-binding domain-containing protein [Actinomycetota bacterium]